MLSHPSRSGSDWKAFKIPGRYCSTLHSSSQSGRCTPLMPMIKALPQLAGKNQSSHARWLWGHPIISMDLKVNTNKKLQLTFQEDSLWVCTVPMCLCHKERHKVPLSIPGIKEICFRATIAIQSQQPTPWGAPWLSRRVFCFLNSVPEGEGEDDLCIYKVVENNSSISCSQETCHYFRILCPIWQGQREEDYSVLWDA